jgi:ATP/maltotriose-dependent transcriptional regulator MalT
VRLWSDDLTSAMGDLGSCADRYQRVGPPHKSIEVQSMLTEANYRIGHWDFAERHGEEAVAVGRDLGIHQLTALALATSVGAVAGRGRWADAEAMVAEAKELLALRGSYQVLGLVWLATARLAAAHGDPQGVVDAFSTMAALGSGMAEVDEQGTLPWRLLYGAAHASLGHSDEAEEQARQLAKFSERGVGRSASPAAARLNGLVAGARGDVDTATRELTQAAAAFGEIAMPFEQAHADFDHGVVLRRAGRRRDAAERLEVARAIFARLEAEPYVQRCDAEIASCGLRGTRLGNIGVSDLTPAESAVAVLVAEGKSNREVAAELVVGVRTVEYHLRNIYSKLGISSRTQLAARLSAGSAAKH